MLYSLSIGETRLVEVASHEVIVLLKQRLRVRRRPIVRRLTLRYLVLGAWTFWSPLGCSWSQPTLTRALNPRSLVNLLRSMTWSSQYLPGLSWDLGRRLNGSDLIHFVVEGSGSDRSSLLENPQLILVRE